jgi:formate dehydrogenase major subunit
MHPDDAAKLGVGPGGMVTVASRRGKVALFARADAGTPRGAVFLPFCFHEAAANLLTNPVLDPFGKIPEFKFCAVRVTAGGAAPERMGYDGSRVAAKSAQPVD